MTNPLKENESMWWPNQRHMRRLAAVGALLAVISTTVAHAQATASREAELATQESRLALWEDDLARRTSTHHRGKDHGPL